MAGARASLAPKPSWRSPASHATCPANALFSAPSFCPPDRLGEQVTLQTNALEQLQVRVWVWRLWENGVGDEMDLDGAAGGVWDWGLTQLPERVGGLPHRALPNQPRGCVVGYQCSMVALLLALLPVRLPPGQRAAGAGARTHARVATRPNGLVRATHCVLLGIVLSVPSLLSRCRLGPLLAYRHQRCRGSVTPHAVFWCCTNAPHGSVHGVEISLGHYWRRPVTASVTLPLCGFNIPPPRRPAGQRADAGG